MGLMRQLVILSLIFAASCSHVVLIKSTPPGATVYIDDEVKGVTPLFFEEASGPGTRYDLRLTLPGYHDQQVALQQDQWMYACVWPSLCLMPFTLCASSAGLLFARHLRDEYHFLLRPLPQKSLPQKPLPQKPLPQDPIPQDAAPQGPVLQIPAPEDSSAAVVTTPPSATTAPLGPAESFSATVGTTDSTSPSGDANAPQ